RRLKVRERSRFPDNRSSRNSTTSTWLATNVSELGQAPLHALGARSGNPSSANSFSTLDRYIRRQSVDWRRAFYDVGNSRVVPAADSRHQRVSRIERAHVRPLRRRAGRLVFFAGCGERFGDLGRAHVLLPALLQRAYVFEAGERCNRLSFDSV